MLWGYTDGKKPHARKYNLNGTDCVLFDDAILVRFSEEPLLRHLNNIEDAHIEWIREVCAPMDDTKIVTDDDATLCTDGGDGGAISNVNATAANTLDDASATAATGVDEEKKQAEQTTLLKYEPYTYCKDVDWSYPGPQCV